MSALHTVNRSPWEHRALERCLARVRPGSGVLLIEDGVLGALRGAPGAARFAEMAGAVEVFALGPDLAARGIEPERVREGVEVVDYGGFVDLACRFDQVVAWT